MVRWVLLALLLPLPIIQSWLDLRKSTRDQSEPPGIALIPILPGSLPRIAAVPGTLGLYPPAAAFLKERRAEEQSRREEAGQAGPLSPGMASPCSHRSQLRGEGRLQEIAGSVTKGEEPVI